MVKPNILHQFASWNNIFTLSVLTVDEVNMPDETYRIGEPSLQILKSGGGLGKNKVTTIYEEIIGGKLEYFIDNVNIEALIAPTNKTRSTNATLIEFTITEPYSMGLFLQTLKIAATQGGYTNYLSAPFLLTVEFVGWDDDGDALVTDDGRNLRRMFPMKFTNVTFEVTSGGTVYNVEAIPWNEQGFLDNVGQAKNDIAIKGETIVSLLQNGEQSLTTVMNGRYEELRKQNDSAVSDEIVITFPQEVASNFNPPTTPSNTDAGATSSPKKGGNGLFGKVVAGVVGGIIKGALNGTLDKSLGGLLTSFKSGDINGLFQNISGFLGAQAPQNFEAFLSMITGNIMTKSGIGEGLAKIAQDQGSLNSIGSSKIIDSFTESGTAPMPQTGQVYDKKNKVMTRAKNVISSNERVFQFKSGTSVIRMIEEVILTSNWSKELKERSPDSNGMIDWFKIECDTFIKPDSQYEQLNGEPAKVYNYKVVPYKVHSSVLQKPTDPGLSYDSLKQTAIKEYNYIYTGANSDIIRFDISLNAAFFQYNMSDSGQNNFDFKTGGIQNRAVLEKGSQLTLNSLTSAISSTGQALAANNIKTSSQGSGGAGIDNSKIRWARAFHDTVLGSGSVDLVDVELEILGDPYFMVDSGMGNYSAASTSQNETVDGTAEFQRSECDIILNFRTPIDYNEETGGMTFPEDTIPVDAFSGLYRVVQVTNVFNGGSFKQRLKLLRRRNQPQDISQTGTQDKAVKVTDATPEQIAYSPYKN
jgi:hypothetical protein